MLTRWKVEIYFGDGDELREATARLIEHDFEVEELDLTGLEDGPGCSPWPPPLPSLDAFEFLYHVRFPDPLAGRHHRGQRPDHQLRLLF